MTVTLFCCLSACYALLSARRLKKVQRYRPLKPDQNVYKSGKPGQIAEEEGNQVEFETVLPSPQLIAPIIVSTSAV